MSGNFAGALEDYKKLKAMPGAEGDVDKKIEAMEAAVKEEGPVGKMALRSQAEERRAAVAQQKRPPLIQEIRVTHGEDVVVVRFPAGEGTYAQLVDQVTPKFPAVKHFKLKFTDRSGETVVCSSAADVQAACEAAHAAALSQGGPKLTALPAARMAVEACAEADMPKPPEEEAKSLDSMKQMRKYIEEIQERQQKAKLEQLAQQASAGSELVEIDSWVVQFAQLFREQLNIDPDRHVDLQAEGWDRVSQALDKVLTSDEAVGLFAQGVDKFKEIIALGHLNWGHAHSALARKHMEDMAKAGVSRGAAAGSPHFAKANEEFAAAEKKMDEAFTYRPDFYDGAVGMGQLWFERAKLEAGMLLTNPATTPEGGEERSKEEEEKAYRECLTKLEKKYAATALPMFERAIQWHDKSAEFARGAVGGTDEKKMEADAAQLKNQSNILAGNVLYEISQITAATGEAGWRAWLEKAVARFKEASCDVADITQALQNHIKSAEVQDLVAEITPKESKGPSLPKKK